METTEDTIRQACRVAGLADVLRLEPLATLPHSSVTRVHLEGGTSCIHKIAGGPAFRDSARREYLINARVLTPMGSPVAPRLLGGDGDAGLPWMLLEDLDPAYRAPDRVPPGKSQLLLMVAALARAHAQSTRLGPGPLLEGIPGYQHCTDAQHQLAPMLEGFLRETPSDAFPANVFELIGHIRDSGAQIAAAIRATQPVLLHGDAHHENALYGESEALLIDWSQCTTGPGEVDLCSTLAMNLPGVFARQWEDDAFQHYAEVANTHGYAVTVDGVRERFRWCLLMTVAVAIAFRSIPGVTHSVWSYLFVNAVDAAFAHDSGALLD